MGWYVICTSNLCHATIGSHNYDGGLITFKSSIQIGEALDIKHMNFVDEKYARNNLSSALFTPFSNLLVNLFADFWFYFTDVTSKKCHKALSSRVDNINLVKSDSVYDFFSLLKFTFGALYESSLRSDIVVVTAAGKW